MRVDGRGTCVATFAGTTTIRGFRYESCVAAIAQYLKKHGSGTRVASQPLHNTLKTFLDMKVASQQTQNT